MLTAIRGALLSLATAAAIVPATSSLAGNGCESAHPTLYICGAGWRSLPLDLPEGISVWSDGEATAKIVIQPIALTRQITDEEILSMAVESVRTTLPDGAALEIRSSDAHLFQGILFANLAYVVETERGAHHFRHAIFVDHANITQVITAASEDDVPEHFRRLLAALVFDSPGTAL